MPKFLAILLLLLCACTPSETPDNIVASTLLVPAGEQAAGPRLSAGAGRPLVLSWMEPDAAGTTLWYSTLADTGWAPPKAVVTGKDLFVNWADLPSVSAFSEDHWVAHWLEMAGPTTYAYHIVMAQSFDGGQTWSEPVKPHTDGTPTEHGFVSVYPHDGKAAAIWLDGRRTGDGHSADHGSDPGEGGMTLRGAVIDADNGLDHEQEIDDLICDCCQTDVAVTARRPVAVYRDRTAAEIRDIYVTRHVDGRWQPGVPLHEDDWQIAGCPVNGPAIAARGETVAAAWFSAPDQVPAVHLRFSEDSAASFGPAITLAADDTLGHVDVVLLGDGSAVVSWLRADTGGRGTLVVRRVTAEGDVGPVKPIVSGAPARSVPQMAVAGDDLVLVWSEAQGDARRIASARIPIKSISADL
jgi:hypothetical protein